MRLGFGSRRKILSVIMTLIMVLSVVAGPATAGIAEEPQETEDALVTPTGSEPIAPAVSPAINSTGNVSVWQFGLLTQRFKPDETPKQVGDSYVLKEVPWDDPAVGYFVNSSSILVNGDIDGQTVDKSLKKDRLYVYESGETVDTTFDGGEGFNAGVIEGEEVHLVTMKLGNNASIPGTPGAVGEFLTENQNVDSEIYANKTGARGVNNFNYKTNESGTYIFATVLNEDGNTTGLVDRSDGNLSAKSNVTIVGFDMFLVRESTTTVQEPADPAPGKNLTFDVDASDTFGANEQVSHTLVLLDEQTLNNTSETVRVSGTGIDGVESGIKRIEGYNEFTDGTNFFGVNVPQSKFQGNLNLISVLNRSAGGTDVTGSGDTVLDMSANSTVTGPQTTITLRTSKNFTPSEYRWLHIATEKEGERTASSSGELTLKQSVELNLTASNTTIKPGDEVEFTVTRKDSGQVTDATITVNGQSYATGADGTVTVSFPDRGEYTATATKAGTADVEFLSDSVPIDVQAPARFQIQSATIEDDDSTVYVGQQVTVNTTVENVGDAVGGKTIYLEANGVEVASESITLAGGETKTVSLTTSFQQAGRKFLNVSDLVDAGVLTVKSGLAVTEFDVNRSTATVGDTATVNATVENSGAIEQTSDVTVYVNGTAVATQSVTLGAGGQDELTFTPIPGADGFDAFGTASIGVNGLDNRTVQVSREQVQLAVETNESTVVEGGHIQFDVTGIGVGAIKGATVEVGDRTAQTDANGEAILRLPTPGEFTANVTKPSTNQVAYGRTDTSITVQAEADLSVVDARIVGNERVPVGSTVDVEVDVRNTGDVTGTLTVNLTENGTTDLDSKDVTVSGKATATETFTRTFDTVGNRTLAANGVRAGVLRVFSGTEVANFTVDRTRVLHGEAVNVTATVQNVGATAESITVRVSINGEVNATREVSSVEPGTTQSVPFDPFPTDDGFATIGTKNLSVNGLEAKQVQVDRRPIQLSLDTNLSKSVHETPREYENDTQVQGEDIRFTVTRNGSTPVPDATVTVNGDAYLTDGNGEVVASVADPGNYTATVSKARSDAERYLGDSVDLTILERADIQYSNLRVAPKQVLVGNDVNTTARVSNEGEINGTATATLLVNGSQVDSKSIHLEPDEQADVSFNRSFSSAGTRTITIDGLVGQAVVVINPPEFTIQNVDVKPPTLTRGGIITTGVRVSNDGGLGGQFNATYNVTNEDTGTVVTRRNKTAFVGAGETRTIRFDRAALSTGNFSFEVNGEPAIVNGTTSDTTVTVEELDALPPAVKLVRPSEGSTPYGAKVRLNVTDSNSSVQSVSATLAGEGVPLSNPSENIYTLRLDGGVDEGTQTLKVTATDSTGNQVTRQFTFDLVSSPRITSVEPTGVVGPSPQVVIEYADDRLDSSIESGVDPSATELYVNGTQTTLEGNAVVNESTLVTELNASVLGGRLTEGTHTARVEITDNAGHTTERRFTFGTDTTSPELELSPDRESNVSTNSPLGITLASNDDNPGETYLRIVRNDSGQYPGTPGEVVFEQNVTDLVRGVSGDVSARWNVTYDNGTAVPSGTYDVVLNSTDAVGNSVQGEAKVAVDNDAPALTVESLSNGTTTVTTASPTLFANETATVTASLNESGAIAVGLVPQRAGSRKIQTMRVGPNSPSNATTFDVSSFTEGRYQVVVAGADGAGNTDTIRDAGVVRVDHTSPGIGASLAVSQAGNIVVNVTSSEPLSELEAVELQDPDGVNQTLTLTKFGTGSYGTVLPTSTSGTYKLSVTGVDRAGNHGSSSASTTLNQTSVSSGENITIYGAGGTFVEIKTSAGVSLPPSAQTTFTESAAPLTRFTNRNAAERYLRANTNLTADQIETVTYGFPVRYVPRFLRKAVDVNIYYVPETGPPQRLTTNNISESDAQAITGSPPDLTGEGRYYVAQRDGLSPYVLSPTDTEKPTLAVTDAAGPKGSNDVPASTSEVNVTVNVTDAISVDESNVSVTLDNGTVTDITGDGTITVTETSTNSSTVEFNTSDLEAGDYVLNVTAPDDAGNQGSVEYEFTVVSDDSKPSTRIESPTSLPPTTTSTLVNVSYVDEPSGDAANATGIDTDPVSIEIDGQDYTSAANVTGSYVNVTKTGLKPDTTHEVNVSVADNAGNAVWENFTFEVRADDFAPNATFTNATPTPNGITVGSDGVAEETLTVDVTDDDLGVDTDNVQVLFDGLDDTSTATITESGGTTTVSYTATGLTAGSQHNFTVVAPDQAGNRVTATKNFSVEPDENNPNITAVDPSDGKQLAASNSSVNVTIKYSDGATGVDTDTVSISVDGASKTSAATVRDTEANVTVSGLQPGTEHTIQASLRDEAGNPTSVLTSFTLNEGPNLVVTSAELNRSSAFTTNQTNVTFTVENIGDERGTKRVRINSSLATTNPVDRKDVTLDAGAKTTVNVTTTFDQLGDNKITVEGTSAGILTVAKQTENFVVTVEVPDKVNVGDKRSVNITATNTGSATGTFETTLRERVMGGTYTPIDSVSASIAASNKRSFKLPVTFSSAGTTTLNLTGEINQTFTVDVRQPGFTVTSSSLSTTSVTSGSSVTVSVEVTNDGAYTEQFTFTLTRGSESFGSRTVTLDSDESKTLTFTAEPTATGTESFQLNGVGLKSLEVNSRGGGGGSGGGGGAAPASDRSQNQIVDGSGRVSIRLPGQSGVSDVQLDLSTGGGSRASVTELSGPPSSTGRPAGGQVVSVLDISVPRNAENQPATIRLTIQQSRLDDLGLTADQLQIERYHGGQWQAIDTRVESQRDGRVVLLGETPGFSYFAVTSKQATATPTATPTPTPEPGTPTATPTPEPEPGTPTATPTPETETPEQVTSPVEEPGGFDPTILIGVLVVLLIAGALVVLRRRGEI